MAEKTQLMVWIDQDLCTGDGLCEEIAPDVFVGRDECRTVGGLDAHVPDGADVRVLPSVAGG